MCFNNKNFYKDIFYYRKRRFTGRSFVYHDCVFVRNWEEYNEGDYVAVITEYISFSKLL